MIGVNESLPDVKHHIIVPVRFIVDGKEYDGLYHENGWFYSKGWMCGVRKSGEIMARGPKAQSRMQTWDELPKHEVSSWEYSAT